jgi:hypothetical protein
VEVFNSNAMYYFADSGTVCVAAEIFSDMALWNFFPSPIMNIAREMALSEAVPKFYLSYREGSITFESWKSICSFILRSFEKVIKILRSRLISPVCWGTIRFLTNSEISDMTFSFWIEYAMFVRHFYTGGEDENGIEAHQLLRFMLEVFREKWAWHDGICEEKWSKYRHDVVDVLVAVAETFDGAALRNIVLNWLTTTAVIKNSSL